MRSALLDRLTGGGGPALGGPYPADVELAQMFPQSARPEAGAPERPRPWSFSGAWKSQAPLKVPEAPGGL